jgi:hypothetical protein
LLAFPEDSGHYAGRARFARPSFDVGQVVSVELLDGHAPVANGQLAGGGFLVERSEVAVGVLQGGVPLGDVALPCWRARSPTGRS